MAQSSESVVVGDRFESIKETRRNALAAVFETFDSASQSWCELTVPDAAGSPSADGQLFGVLRQLAAVHDEHLIAPSDFGRSRDGSLYVLARLPTGTPLRTMLRQRESLPTANSVELIVQVCRGLAAAHDRGIYHGGICPETLLLARGQDGSVIGRICDFGLLIHHLATKSANASALLDSAFTVYGAPEYATLGVVPGASQDVYSLGAVLLRLLCGTAPGFGGVIAADDSAKLPARLASVMRKALAPNAQDRFSAVTELAEALAEFASGPFGDLPPGVRLADGRSGALPRGWSGCVVIESPRPSEKPFLAAPAASSPPGPARKFELHNLPADLMFAAAAPAATAAAPAATAPVTAAASSLLPHVRVDDDVLISVYRPKTVAPGRWYTLLAYAHLGAKRPDDSPNTPDPIEEVQRRATSALADLAKGYRATTQEALLSLPQGGLIQFVPRVPGIEFNPRVRSFAWYETIHEEMFKFRVAPQADGTVLRGRLTAYLDSILLADVRLSFTVNQEPHNTDTARNSARAYRKIFASYSHRDRRIVEQFAAVAGALGERYLIDVRDLRSGEVWNQRLEALIEQADIFQLFWSSHTMRSAFCRQEWEYALRLSRSDFIRPVYWEDPMPRDDASGLPPAALNRLHFAYLANQPPAVSPDSRRAPAATFTATGTEIPPVAAIAGGDSSETDRRSTEHAGGDVAGATWVAPQPAEADGKDNCLEQAIEHDQKDTEERATEGKPGRWPRRWLTISTAAGVAALVASFAPLYLGHSPRETSVAAPPPVAEPPTVAAPASASPTVQDDATRLERGAEESRLRERDLERRFATASAIERGQLQKDLDSVRLRRQLDEAVLREQELEQALSRATDETERHRLRQKLKVAQAQVETQRASRSKKGQSGAARCNPEDRPCALAK